ncbi:hypothetical protein JL101_035670 (plasmid) [Skermanella rosea]|uniref:hypothetical protein n=1 Tax=Skermanella rosea TaxID=1817965 RepID=UPI0019315380|nr:hypothetical protein [Skermanella rosea]UEM07991.1 hypothetical protein JL101_035670 [Skermanella rosea]
MDAELREALDGIKTSIDALTQGLSMMVETQETQSEMLARLLEAASEEADGDDSLSKTLKRIAVTLSDQTEALVRIGGMLTNIGPTVETAVLRGIQRAVNGADEDGVVEG